MERSVPVRIARWQVWEGANPHGANSQKAEKSTWHKPTLATLSFRRRALGRTQGLGFEVQIFIGENFGKLSKSGVEIESPR